MSCVTFVSPSGDSPNEPVPPANLVTPWPRRIDRPDLQDGRALARAIRPYLAKSQPGTILRQGRKLTLIHGSGTCPRIYPVFVDCVEMTPGFLPAVSFRRREDNTRHNKRCFAHECLSIQYDRDRFKLLGDACYRGDFGGKQFDPTDKME